MKLIKEGVEIGAIEAREYYEAYKKFSNYLQGISIIVLIPFVFSIVCLAILPFVKSKEK